MTERLQKILSASGVASRRHAEKLIKEGRVTCNGNVCVLGEQADPAVDEICVDGKPIPVKEKHVYILLNKPRGYVTTLSDEKGRRNVSQLVDCGCRVYPVGRLDMDSDGLLIMTNDGEFANRVMHPRHEINKTYIAIVENYTEQGFARLSEPIDLDGYQIKKPDAVFLGFCDGKNNLAKIQVTIHEGRNRQVRRMCAFCGMNVVRLTRIAEGNLNLGDLKVGSWRYFTQEELQKFESLH